MSRAELISKQAEEFLNLRWRQHWFDEVGECTRVHLEKKKGKEGNSAGTVDVLGKKCNNLMDIKHSTKLN